MFSFSIHSRAKHFGFRGFCDLFVFLSFLRCDHWRLESERILCIFKVRKFSHKFGFNFVFSTVDTFLFTFFILNQIKRVINSSGLLSRLNVKTCCKPYRADREGRYTEFLYIKTTNFIFLTSTMTDR